MFVMRRTHAWTASGKCQSERFSKTIGKEGKMVKQMPEAEMS